MKELKVSRIRISNILGVKELEVKPGDITIFGGQNMTGKTSVLKAVTAALTGALDAESVHHDEEAGEIRVDLSDGVEELSITRRVTAKGRKSLRVSDGRADMRKPQHVLDELFSGDGLNPIDFLRAKKGKRTDVLLQALPIELSQKEIAGMVEGCGLETKDVRSVKTEGVRATDALAALHRCLYDERTAVNRQVSERKKWIAKEERDLGQVEDPGDALEAAMLEKGAFAAERTKVEAERDRCRDARLAKGLLKARLAKLGERKETLEAHIAETVSDIDIVEKELAAVQTQDDGPLFDRLSQLASEQSEADVRIDELKEARGRWEERKRREGRIEAESEALATLTTRSKSLTHGVNWFGRDALNSLLAKADLPINGLSFKDGKLYVDDTHIESLSGAETMQLAVQVARTLAARHPLKLVLVDGLESLDTEQRELFFEAITGDGFQYLLTEIEARKAPGGASLIVMSGGLASQ